MKSIVCVLFLGVSTLFASSLTHSSSSELPSAELLASVAVPAPALAETSPEAAPVAIRIRGRVRFGRASRNCRGFGICSASVGVSGPGVSVVVSGNKNGVVTSMEFDLASMTAQQIKTYFSKSTFVVEEAFSVKLDSKEGQLSLKIGKGEYTLKKSEKGFIMYIKG